MSAPEAEDEGLTRRRVAILLLFFVALLGLGVGTLVDGPDDTQPPVIEATPTPPTTTAPPPGTPPDTTPTPPDDGTPSPPPTTPTPPTAAPPDGDGSGGGGSGAGGGSPVTLETAGSSAILQYGALKPSDAGSDTITLRNAGSVPARLDITDITVTDDENGIVPAEAPVDSPGDGGELSDHVMVVIEVTYPDGTTEHAYATDLGARSLSDLAGISSPATGRELDPGAEATVTFDWHVPAGTGNEIQSDSADFTVDFRLRTT